jgi:hypothetical protein
MAITTTETKESHNRLRPILAVIGAVLAMFHFGLNAAVLGPPIADGVLLNIGLNCKWQTRCMSTQAKAMKRSLDYVRKAAPANWRIHQCNRNAARSRYRIDWVGFDNCIRNPSIRASLHQVR